MPLNYNRYLETLNEDDVLEIFNQLVKSKDLKFALEDSFEEPIQQKLIDHLKYREIGNKMKIKRDVWFNEGVDCKMLKAGANGWQKGKLKIKVSVEFIPDEPELPVYQSPLDEIYREIQGLQ